MGTRLAGLSLILATGCATLTAPRTELLPVASNPPGAQIIVNGAVQASTPATLAIDRHYPPFIELALPGYQTQVCRPFVHPGGFYVFSDVLFCVFLFPIGCISFIDAAGAWNVYDPRGCYVNLTPLGAPGPQGYTYEPLPPGQALPSQPPPPPAQPPQPVR